jgi:hypothetical protein
MKYVQDLRWDIVERVFLDQSGCAHCEHFTLDDTDEEQCTLIGNPTACPGFVDRWQEFSDELEAAVMEEMK